MNVPPVCEDTGGSRAFPGWEDAPTQEILKCKGRSDWHVIDKTAGKQYEFCKHHLQRNLTLGHTYSVFPAKDYSRPRSFDQEYLCEPFEPDPNRCIRCDGEMVLAMKRDKIPDFPRLGGKQDGKRRLKPADTMVCRECGGEQSCTRAADTRSERG